MSARGGLPASRRSWRRIALAKILLDAGANPNAALTDGRTPLHHAASSLNDAELVRLLLSRGANPNVGWGEGNTPLFSAVLASRGTRRALFEGGANINAVNASGETALHFAAKLASADAVEDFLRFGADPFAQDRHGLLPLDVAHGLASARHINHPGRVGSLCAHRAAW